MFNLFAVFTFKIMQWIWANQVYWHGTLQESRSNWHCFIPNHVIRFQDFPTVRFRAGSDSVVALTGTDGRNSWDYCVFQRVTVVFSKQYQKCR